MGPWKGKERGAGYDVREGLGDVSSLGGGVREGLGDVSKVEAVDRGEEDLGAECGHWCWW